ncbi:MAG: kynureninase [Acidimicrobiia bacterium]|nr:kynureninase [Acidimicrobiia bacterium]MDX2465834.1 kynureninase [Acidimicrobiia bacterium]
MTAIELGPFPTDPAYTEAVESDGTDPLRSFRSRFVAPDPDLIYLDGNSLGRLPVDTISRIQEVVDVEWGSQLIRSWPERWWNLADELGSQLARLIGAAPEAVVVADSTSVILYKLTTSAMQARPKRKRIVTDNLNFPTDIYVAGAVGEVSVVVVSPWDDDPEQTLIDALDANTALLLLSHVAFKSGYLYDMERLTRAAHEAGALVLWDLSHSVGVVPIDLTGCDVDLATGCTYKYLNGGPGAPAFLYVSPNLEMENPLPGWWGHRDPFSFSTDFEPADSIHRFQTGTMPILSLSAIEPAINLVAEAGLEAIRAKSVELSEFFSRLSDRLLQPLGFSLASPRDSKRRGSHVSLQHRDGWRATQALIKDGKVIPDFRAPDNIRFGFAPLYTSFVDVHTSVMRLTELFAVDAMSRHPDTRGSVS